MNSNYVIRSCVDESSAPGAAAWRRWVSISSRLAIIGLLGCAVTGCGSKEEPAPSSSSAAGSGAVAGSAAAPAAKGKDPKELFTPGKVMPPGELATLTADDNEAAAKAKLKGLDPSPAGIGKLPGFDGVIVSLDATERGLENVHITPGPKAAELLPVLTAAWGKPVATDAHWIWLDPATGWSALLHTRNDWVEYAPIKPLAHFLSDGPSFAFETTPIIGMAAADFEREYAGRLRKTEKPAQDGETGGRNRRQPPYDASYAFDHVGTEAGRVEVVAYATKGKMTSMLVAFANRYDPSANEKVMAWLAKRYGAGKPTKRAGSMTFAAKPPIVADVQADGVTLRVGGV